MQQTPKSPHNADCQDWPRLYNCLFLFPRRPIALLNASIIPPYIISWSRNVPVNIAPSLIGKRTLRSSCLGGQPMRSHLTSPRHLRSESLDEWDQFSFRTQTPEMAILPVRVTMLLELSLNSIKIGGSELRCHSHRQCHPLYQLSPWIKILLSTTALQKLRELRVVFISHEQPVLHSFEWC